jgi:hypothetical protein
MARKSLIFSAVVALSIILRVIPTIAQRNDGPRSAGGVGQAVNERTAKVPDTKPAQDNKDQSQQESVGKNDVIQPTVDQASPKQADAPLQPPQDWELQRKEMTDFERATIKLAKITLLVTTIGAVIGIGVLIIYSLQLEQMRRSTDASVSAATAAKVSADTALTGLKISQRADMAVLEPALKSPIEVDKPLSLQVQLWNNGASRAEIFDNLICYAITPAMPETPIYQSCHQLGGLSVVARGKFVFRTFQSNQLLTQAMIDEIQSGVASLYIWGKIQYRDVFMESHTTGFIMRYIPGQTVWSLCPEYPQYHHSN